MTHALREVLQSLRTWPVFAFYVLVTLAVAGIIALITFDVIDLGMTHFGEASHRTHDVTYGLLFTTLVVGTFAQLRQPGRNVAGMVMALIPVAALLLAAVLSSDVDAVFDFNPLRYAAAVTVVAALLHPTGRTFFRSFTISRVNWVLLALVGIAAVPLIAFASTSIRRQRTVADMHVFMGHYGFMAALSFTVIAVGIVASMRPVGWRLTAWVAGLLPTVLGATSILYPDAASSLDLTWALAAIAWGVGFIAVAAVTGAAAEPTLPDRQDPAMQAGGVVAAPTPSG
jgi:hypothetical protein